VKIIVSIWKRCSSSDFYFK